MRAHIPIEQPTTVTLSVRGCLGGPSARGVQGSAAEGRPIRFVPSVWYKRQKLLKIEHVHAKLTMTPDAPPSDMVVYVVLNLVLNLECDSVQQPDT